MKKLLLILCFLPILIFGQITTSKDSICLERGHIWNTISATSEYIPSYIQDFPDSTIRIYPGERSSTEQCERCGKIEIRRQPDDYRVLWRSKKYQLYLDSIQFKRFPWN
jgi:hypothetical protein